MLTIDPPILVYASVMQRIGRALAVGGTLTAGFVLLFSVAGAVISGGAYLLVNAMPWIGFAVGIVLTVLGVAMFARWHFPPRRTAGRLRVDPSTKRA